MKHATNMASSNRIKSLASISLSAFELRSVCLRVVAWLLSELVQPLDEHRPGVDQFLGIVQIPEIGGPDLSVLDRTLERLSIRIVVDDSHAHQSSAASRYLVVEPSAANRVSSVAFHDVDPRNEQTRGNSTCPSTDRITNVRTQECLDDDRVKHLTVHYPPENRPKGTLRSYRGRRVTRRNIDRRLVEGNHSRRKRGHRCVDAAREETAKPRPVPLSPPP